VNILFSYDTENTTAQAVGWEIMPFNDDIPFKKSIPISSLEKISRSTSRG
jgi:hypothetical protein